MKPAVVLAVAASLALAPKAGFAASPVEVSYDDAVKCAAVDTVILGVMSAGSENKTQSDDDKKLVDYYTGMAQKWLAQAVEVHPQGQDAAFADFDKATDAITRKIVAAKDEQEVSAAITTDLASCTQLEEAAFGGLDGKVN